MGETRRSRASPFLLFMGGSSPTPRFLRGPVSVMYHPASARPKNLTKSSKKSADRHKKASYGVHLIRNFLS
jgi:hypothetical protein